MFDAGDMANEVAQGLDYLASVLDAFDIDARYTDTENLGYTAQRLFSYGLHARVMGDVPTPAEILPLVYLVQIARSNTLCEPLYGLESAMRLTFARSKVDLNIVKGIPDYRELMCQLSIPKMRLTLKEVAGLARMTEIAVRNALNNDDAPFQFTKEDHELSASVESVRPWLEGRKAYMKTIVEKKTDEGEKLIKVPVARDGSVFSTECRLKSGFRVGEKGSEKVIDDVYEALNYLVGMSTAKWRRRNSNGIPGIVSAVDWREISVSAFEGLPAQDES
jgi:hypothetical protein